MSRTERIKNGDIDENSRFCDKNCGGDDCMCHFKGICHNICHHPQTLDFLIFIIIIFLLVTIVTNKNNKLEWKNKIYKI